MYKYSCRKCPVRNRCIDESANSPGAKVMVRRAFEARTDTLSTWGLLQKNCLLIKAEQERSSTALSSRLHRQVTIYEADQPVEADDQAPSALSVRLLKAREAHEEEDVIETESGETAQPKKPAIRRLRPLTTSAKKGTPDSQKHTQHPDYLQPVPASKAKGPTTPLKRLTSTGPLSQRHLRSHWLIVENSGRRITLPLKGKLIFGRFDPNVGIPPDIDLNFEDQGDHLISRRHAGIIGHDGKHAIEDLGSTSGVFLNGERLQKGPSRVLKPGDQIMLGEIGFLYDKIPASILNIAEPEQVKHVFTVTPTGRTMTVVPHGEFIIGRADPHLTFVPDIDLREDGVISERVSRRHAVIRWRKGSPFLEDLGSSFGTRLLGEMLALGKSVPLRPGDHIWLGGCVLAYDIKTEGGG